MLIAVRVEMILIHHHFNFNMIKKILALATGTLFSLNASAGYIQYNFTGELSGYVVQRTDNKAIADYKLRVLDANVDTKFTPWGYLGNLTAAYNAYSGEGPTGFRIFSNNAGSTAFDTLRVNFEANNSSFAYAALFEHGISYEGDVAENKPLIMYAYHRAVTQSAVDPALVAALDKNGGYALNIRRFGDVQEIPEPATLGLLAIGALGVAGVSRRRKAAV